MRTANSRWKIESGTDFITGKPNWVTTPPRFVYSPRAEGKRSHDTYDQGRAHVLNATGRRPLVFESKTHIGEWFWSNPDGSFGWEKDRNEAHAKAHQTSIETENT